MPSHPSAVRLRVALRGARPAISRTLIAPLTIRLDQLHQVLQAAFGWTDSHLYEFRAGRFAWSMPQDTFGETGSDVRRTSLRDALKRAGTRPLHYVYDFGDCWTHDLGVEERIGAPAADTTLRLVAARGRCPPEDIGGTRAYARLTAALKDPADPDHDHACDMLGEEYDSTRIDQEALADRVARLAAVWGMASGATPP